MKPRSHDVTDGYERAPARAMLRAVGMSDDDWDKPQVAVASSWNEVTPVQPAARAARAGTPKQGVRWAGGFPLEFTTIAVSDGISMGHEGMRASLVSREVIADSVELMMHAERLDGLVLLAGCDKCLPGHAHGRGAARPAGGVPLRRLDPARGTSTATTVTIQDVFEAVGACALGQITRERLGEIERAACPSEGSCGGMFTANTMATAAEALGMSLPGSASAPAVDGRRDYARRSPPAKRWSRCSREGITARQILTKPAFENAIAVVMALGGSTNAVLHLLAIAHEARSTLTMADFDRIGRKVPHLGRREAVRPLRHERRRRHRRRARRHARAAARRRPARRRRAHRHRQDRGARTSPTSTRRRRTATSSTRSAAPIARDRRHRDPARLARPGGRRREVGGHGVAWSSRAPRGCSTARPPRWRPSPRGHIQPGRRHRHPLGRPAGRAGHARDARRDRRGEGRRAVARTSRCSPTAGSPARPSGCASVTSRPRRPTAARSRWSPRATGSCSTCPTAGSTCSVDDAELERRRA